MGVLWQKKMSFALPAKLVSLIKRGYQDDPPDSCDIFIKNEIEYCCYD